MSLIPISSSVSGGCSPAFIMSVPKKRPPVGFGLIPRCTECSEFKFAA